MDTSTVIAGPQWAIYAMVTGDRAVRPRARSLFVVRPVV